LYPFPFWYGMHSRVLIDLLWYVYYSSLFQFFFLIYYCPYSSWKLLFSVLKYCKAILSSFKIVYTLRILVRCYYCLKYHMCVIQLCIVPVTTFLSNEWHVVHICLSVCTMSMWGSKEIVLLYIGWNKKAVINKFSMTG